MLLLMMIVITATATTTIIAIIIISIDREYSLPEDYIRVLTDIDFY